MYNVILRFKLSVCVQEFPGRYEHNELALTDSDEANTQLPLFTSKLSNYLYASSPQIVFIFS